MLLSGGRIQNLVVAQIGSQRRLPGRGDTEGQRGLGLQSGLGSGGGAVGDEQEGRAHPRAPRWARSWVFDVVVVGSLESFKLMIVLIRFAS